MEEQKKENIFIKIVKSPIIIFKNIIIYISLGVKFVFYDLLIMIYNFFRYQFSKPYTNTKKNIMVDELNLYERTKSKPKKEKVYKYSERYLKKLNKDKQ